MTCPECRGTGIYTGFLVTEPCSRGCEPPRPWSDDDQRREWDAYGEAAEKAAPVEREKRIAPPVATCGLMTARDLQPCWSREHREYLGAWSQPIDISGRARAAKRAHDEALNMRCLQWAYRSHGVVRATIDDKGLNRRGREILRNISSGSGG